MTPENPQMEHGFVGLANALYERIYQSNLPAKELGALMYVIRVTYGFRAKAGPVYTVEMAEDIEIDQRYARRLLESLCERKILIKTAKATGRIPAYYTLNKNWREWKHERKCDFPPLKDGRRRVTHYPPTNSAGCPTTRLNEANYPPKCSQITRLSDTKLPAIVSKDAEQTGPVSTPIQKTEDIRHNPPTPKGAGGGEKSENSLRELLRSNIQSWGWQATKKDLDRAEDLVRGPTPAGWEKVTWRKHTLRRLYEQVQEVEAEMAAGAKIYSPVTIGAHRAQARLALDAKTPQNFEQRKEAI